MDKRRHLSILLADAHDVVRRGLRSLVSQRLDWRVCGEARNGRDAIDLTAELRPDIIILDLENVGGSETARQIKKAHAETEILNFTVQDEEYRVRPFVPECGPIFSNRTMRVI
jgi:DNA-binding NarL/FixJ family response regulator